MHYATKITLCC